MLCHRKLIGLMLVLAVLLAAGCGAQNDAAKNSLPPQQIPAAQKNAAALTPEADRKQIQTAAIALETQVFADTEKRMTDMVQTSGGLIESSQVTANQEGLRNGHFVLRVPQDKLTAVVDTIASLPDTKLRSRSVNSQDVTEEHIDVNARLDNLRLQEQRLRQLLALAATVDEIIKIEGELSKVRTQLDAAAGRLKNLNSRIALSAVTVTVSETKNLRPDSYAGELVGAFREGFRAAGDTLLATITFVIATSPALAVFLGLWRLWKAWKRRSKPN